MKTIQCETSCGNAIGGNIACPALLTIKACNKKRGTITITNIFGKIGAALRDTNSTLLRNYIARKVTLHEFIASESEVTGLGRVE